MRGWGNCNGNKNNAEERMENKVRVKEIVNNRDIN